MNQQQQMNETIANMARASTPGMLLFNQDIEGAGPQDSQIILAMMGNNQFLWCYRQGHPTIYGTFYMGAQVQRIDGGGVEGVNMGDNGGEITFVFRNGGQQPRFAIKWVSIERYRENGMGMTEDPYNEIGIAEHMRRIMGDARITNNGIIIPIGVISNETQTDIGANQRYFFILSQLANGGDLFDAATGDAFHNDDGRNMGAVRNLFRQMVRAIDFLHNELRVFHRDLSVENFVIHNNGELDDRVYVIDFGQAQIINHGEETILHDNTHFGKPAYTPPELIHGDANLLWKKVDVFALGVTLYYMFFGQPPMWSMSNSELVRTNVIHRAFLLVCRQGRLADFVHRNGITHIPDEALEVLQGMLWEDPNRRLSTEQILNHPWLR